MVQSQGIKIAKPGVDVLTETDKDLQFTTKYSTLKIFSYGDTSFTTDENGDGSVTIPHNLGFSPAFFVWCKDTASWTFMDASSYTNSFFPIGSVNSWHDNGWTDGYFNNIMAYTDPTNLGIIADDAKPSTTYNFRYYILVDLAQDFSGVSKVGLTKNYGFKVAKPGVDVETANEYELGYSSKYKALQYYDESIKTQALTLPAMWSSKYDPVVEEGTYVDFNHGLGYQPFYLAYMTSDRIFTNSLIEVPFSPLSVDDEYGTYVEYSSFCDTTKVRVSFYRYVSAGLSGYGNFAEETITVKVYIFTENLTGT